MIDFSPHVRHPFLGGSLGEDSNFLSAPVKVRYASAEEACKAARPGKHQGKPQEDAGGGHDPVATWKTCHAYSYRCKLQAIDQSGKLMKVITSLLTVTNH